MENSSRGLLLAVEGRSLEQNKIEQASHSECASDDVKSIQDGTRLPVAGSGRCVSHVHPLKLKLPRLGHMLI